MNILMVCLGNICRSPLAEGIMKHHIEQINLSWKVDSAGTGGWHQGELPDRRSVAVARKNGINITDQRARQLVSSDFHEFDHILVMDSNNYVDVKRMAPEGDYKAKIELIRNFVFPGRNLPVEDPYYGGTEGFDHIFSILDEACMAFIKYHS